MKKHYERYTPEIVEKVCGTSKAQFLKVCEYIGSTGKAGRGQPAEQRRAAANDADHLILGRRGTGGFSRLTLGSVSSQVAQHAACPVTIVPD